MNKIFTIIFSFLLSLPIFAVYPDSFEAVAADNYTIDGMSDEAYWDEAIWYDLQYVWLPYGTTVSTSDFSGRVKLAWTSDRLLVFAEINDNIFPMITQMLPTNIGKMIAWRFLLMKINQVVIIRITTMLLLTM